MQDIAYIKSIQINIYYIRFTSNLSYLVKTSLSPMDVILLKLSYKKSFFFIINYNRDILCQ